MTTAGVTITGANSRERFERSYPFAFDGFQHRALDAIDAGRSVVVAAPTGSGKTIVAEYAVAKALDSGGRAFYTTPIKALSNQKYHDLCARHGRESVGLLTGDTSINDSAPVVVMTTEVLRNMLYVGSGALEGLRYVVLDEVHFLQDAFRGPVWEEVIIHAPPEVDLVCLSATVSNAEELADWVASVRGATEVVISDERPVELTQLYLVAERNTGDIDVLPMFVDGRPNQAAARYDSDQTAAALRSRSHRRPATPRRTEIIEVLRDRDMLPAIYFIFSRAACDDAVGACLRHGLRLTRPDERERIRAIVETHVSSIGDDDLQILDFTRFLSALEAGFAAHHAGMVPQFKEAVERCFVAGLVKVVFATETLAVGINMPARSVVIEKLSKFGGERHEFLTPGEYTQLTGRAGRRGIDPVGFAVTLWTPFVAFEQIAALASRRSYELRSSFRPTYNMAVNLVQRYSPDNANHLLRLSFAQYQADADLHRQHAHVDRLRRSLAAFREQARCELGDIEEYRREHRAPARPTFVTAPESEVAAALDAVRPGDVLAHASGAPRGARSLPSGDANVLVISTARRRGSDVQLRAVTTAGRVVTLTARDFHAVPEPLAHIRLPTPFHPNSRSFQQAAAAALLRADQRAARSHRTLNRGRSAENERVAELPAVERCPDLGRHLKAAARADRAADDIARIEVSSDRRSGSIADTFDRVLQLLEERGYIDGWAITDRGRMLAGIFHECDLLISDCIDAGVLDGLDPPQVAALASVFVFEARGPGARERERDRVEGTAPPGFPRTLAKRWADIEWIASALSAKERALGLPETRLPDPGFAAVALGWASGNDLEAVLDTQLVTGGDFVRTTKALIDLLRQIGQVTPRQETCAAARAAADAIHRGVVAAGSARESAPDAPARQA